MQRRQFLKLGGLSTLTAAVPSAAMASDAIDEEDVRRAIARLDAGLSSLDRVHRRRFDTHPMVDGRPQLRLSMRRMLRGLYGYQVFREMPLEIQVHPDSQERMATLLTELARGLEGVREAMGSIDEAEFDALEPLWQRHHEAATGDLLGFYRVHGGSERGERRVARLVSRVERDVHRAGLKRTLQRYARGLDSARGSAPRPLSLAEKRRVARAKAHWATDAEHNEATAGGVVGAVLLVGLGVAAVVFGVIVIAASAPAMAECFCIAILGIALGVGLIMLGILAFYGAYKVGGGSARLDGAP